MYLVILLVFLGLLLFSYFFRTLFLPPCKAVYFAVKDLYIKRKAWNNCPTGHLICYFAHFGGGKTLSATEYITRLYHRYNDKPVYDHARRKMVTQKIEVLSNAEFVGVPYVPLNALNDITARATYNKGIDMDNDTLTVTIVFIDEASSELNSREYKNNFDMDTLNTLITCSRTLRKLCKLCDVRYFNTHPIRKTFATMLHDSGVPTRVISDLLGHSDIATTENSYILSYADKYEQYLGYMRGALKFTL
ncbi:MAG: tyrosine-type recombinase/integrase [Acetatifactor sp.]|nr:tyrosine-type recombinase/integrase [Acetatifactor sp.]